MANALSYTLPEQENPLSPIPSAPTFGGKPQPQMGAGNAAMPSKKANALTMKAPKVAPPVMPQRQKPRPMGSASPNALATAFGSQQQKPDAMYAFMDTLQRTMDPAAADAREQRMTTQQQQKLQQGLAFVQQMQALPAEQRMAFVQQGAGQFGLGQTQFDANAFTDEALAQSIATLSAQLGQGPTAPEYMNLGGGNVGMVRDGKFSLAREAPEEAKPTWEEVNGRIIDKNDPKKVLADYSDQDPEQGVKWETEMDASGNMFQVNPYTGEKRPLGMRGRVPGAGDGSAAKPSYTYKEVNGRLMAINEANPRDMIDLGPAGSGVPAMTPMQKKVDENWAGTLVEWADGGSSDFVKQMSQLDYAIGEMEKAVANPGSVELSGPGNNLFPGGLGRAQFGQHGLKVQQAVEEVAQRNLRAVLGPAFTAKEGEGLIARAYDPSMEEGENLKRVRRLYTQMNIAAQQKTDAMNYYNEHGSMMGYQGHIPTLADFEAALDDEDNEAAKASTPKPQGASTYGSIPSAAQVPGQGGFQWGAPTKPAPQAQAQNDTPPPGIDPELWQYMDPADKAKFRR